jgi:hypothetical protein
VRVTGSNTLTGTSVNLTGDFAPPSTGSAHGVELQGATLNGSGNLTIVGRSTDDRGVRLDNTIISRGSGNLVINGGQGGTTVSGNNTSLTATTGSVEIRGEVPSAQSGEGVLIRGTPTLSGTSVLVAGTANNNSGHGVHVDGAKVNGTGSLRIEGTQGAAAVPAPAPSPNGHGILINSDSDITRSASLTLVGTANNSTGSGVRLENSTLNTQTQNLSITGSSAGTGVLLRRDTAYTTTVSGAELNIIGSSTAANPIGVELDRQQVSPTQSVTAHAQSGALRLSNGTAINNSGNSGVTLRASNAGQSIQLVNDETVRITDSATGEITFRADRIEIGSDATVRANNAASRVVLRPETDNRPIELGASDSAAVLGLDNTELNRITSPILVVGYGTHGSSSSSIGISLQGSISPANAPDLSLITAGPIAQGTPPAPDPVPTITATGLNLDGGSVDLNPLSANHSVSRLAGHARSGNFAFRNAGNLEIGRVDGQDGLTALGQNRSVTIRSNGNITQTQLIRGVQQWSSGSTGGTVLTHSGNEVGEFLNVENRTPGNVELTTAGNTRYTQVTNAGGGAVLLRTTSGSADVSSVNAGTGQVQVTSATGVTLGHVQTTSTAAANTFADASVAIMGAGPITQATAAPAQGIETGGSVFLQTTNNGAIGTTADPIKVNTSTTTGLVTVDAADAQSILQRRYTGTTPFGAVSSPGNISISGPGGASTPGHARLGQQQRWESDHHGLWHH